MSTIRQPSRARAAFQAHEMYGAWSVLGRMLVRVLEARSPSAERVAAVDFEGLPDERLAILGYSDAEIASLRAGRPVSSIIDQG